MKYPTVLSSAEQQLKFFNTFLEEHDLKMKKMFHIFHPSKFGSHKIFVKPIVELDYSTNKECLSLLKLLESDRNLNKILLTFGHICEEIEYLVKNAFKMEAKFLFWDENLLAIANDDVNKSSKRINEKLIFQISSSIEFLFQMQFLLQRLFLVGNNILHQCGVYLRLTTEAEEFKFYEIFENLSELLYHLVILDEILFNSNLTIFWPLYKEAIDSLLNCETRRVSIVDGNGIKQAILELDYLVSGSIFRNFLDSLFSLKEKIGSNGISLLIQQFNEYLKLKLNDLNKYMECNDLIDCNQKKILIKSSAFCVLFHNFCGQVDNKLIKVLLEINSKHQGLMLIGNIPWKALNFFRKNAESLIKPYEEMYFIKEQSRQQHFLHNHVHNFGKECRSYSLIVSQWIMKMNNYFKSNISDIKFENFKEVATLLSLGLRYIGQISVLIKANVYMHVSQKMRMTRLTVFGICKLLQLIQVIQETFEDKMPGIAKVVQYIMQYLQYNILHMLSYSKKKIVSLKLQGQHVDALVAIKFAERCMNGPPTSLRILLSKMAVNSSKLSGRILTVDQFGKFMDSFKKLVIFHEFQENLKRLFIPLFMFWNQSILSTYLKQILETDADSKLFKHLMEMSDQCKKELNMLQLQDLIITKNFGRHNYSTLRKNIISSLCAQAEHFLRLEIHYNLELNKIHPFDHSLKDYRNLIHVSPIKINGNYINLKDHIENYLSCMIYNLTTISLNDWKTYEKMQILANNRLALNPVLSYLPTQSLEQGIDILEIMRNIHIFVSKYVYNMNSQMFIEQSSPNKHLDSINIRHIANSLRTHGTGVINTTINFTYQFLRQKFYTFSQFLYDEQIRSRLLKEYRRLSDRKFSDTFPTYTYERADAFNKDIRKLGLSSDGQTYMDLFRKVITHVGNAVGYIRLIRSGSIHANYNATAYLPTFDHSLKMLHLDKQISASDATIYSAEYLERNIYNIGTTFTDSVDYFKILLEAFQPFFQNPSNMHLKNFFLIIPPLTLNYVEYILNVKEKIVKRDLEDAILFDDGFAIGVAYILKLLDQIGEFNSLQWFATVKAKFDEERRKIEEMFEDVSRKPKDENEKLIQTLALTERRITAHQIQYHLLFYNLGSAKIFFQ